ncbi:MAG TPA: cadmium resistance transporter [Actinocrinis sp.]|uniref:cadmium resistance transporter n=1 Tax=Actinocrinis sp. TaxID=1920516 RepID=UPI002DDD3CE7|nr:cadmium resistance transporter [Actinocrinis sp.]HEV2344011.1 cadmium resistance transporter [Actinocrinis sp.]
MSASLLATAALAFAVTTIDDLVVLSALFIARRATGLPRARAIVAGQYTGFAVILALSLAAAAGLRIVPDRWVGLLGLVPVGLGVWQLWRLRGAERESRAPLASTATRIAAITLAGGADNISVFTPLFRALHVAGSLLAAGVFLVMIALWCATGALLADRTPLTTALGRATDYLVPVVFIAVGVLILITTGTITTIQQSL